MARFGRASPLPSLLHAQDEQIAEGHGAAAIASEVRRQEWLDNSAAMYHRLMSAPPDLTLEWLPGAYAVCRLEADATVPEWAACPPSGAESGALLSVTRTERELSIVAPAGIVPDHVQASRGWRAARVRGTLDFNLVGVLAQLTGALAAADVPVFVISTYDTDIMLVQDIHASIAEDALAPWLGDR